MVSTLLIATIVFCYSLFREAVMPGLPPLRRVYLERSTAEREPMYIGGQPDATDFSDDPEHVILL